jgi:hypothetical protein
MTPENPSNRGLDHASELLQVIGKILLMAMSTFGRTAEAQNGTQIVV